MGIIILDTRGDLRPSLDQEMYRKVTGINWKTSHSRRLQRLCGNPKLVVGYDGDAKAWAIAHVQSTVVKDDFGSRERTHIEELPNIWSHWRRGIFEDVEPGELDTPLCINDPRLPTYILACDRTQGGAQAAAELKMKREKTRAMAKAALRRERRALAYDLHGKAVGAANALGISYHRPVSQRVFARG